VRASATPAAKTITQRLTSQFRSRYLITYRPRGVDAGGWHPIELSVKGRKVTVTARRGYSR